MANSHLTDPRDKYYTGGYPSQDEQIPALQVNMGPKPDCGEESYKGNQRLKGRSALITGGGSGIGRATVMLIRVKVRM